MKVMDSVCLLLVSVLSCGAAAGPEPDPVGQQEATGGGDLSVTAENTLSFARAAETIEIPWTAGAATVMEEGKPIPSQLFEGKVLFQSDFAPGQTKHFTIHGTNGPTFPDRTYGRHVPERYDDYAWENDRIAFRIYGPGLETAKGQPLVSSGIDVWLKRTRNLVIDSWYKSGKYHEDHGDGLDNYSCGPYRGCGGIGVWTGDKLHVSRNWATQRTLATGPVRTVAEVTYARWDAGDGVSVSESRRISLDAGSNLNRFESRFDFVGTDVVTIAVGLDVSEARKHNGVVSGGGAKGFFANWEPELKPHGNTATAIVMAEDGVKDARYQDQVLLLAPARAGEPFVWYAGAGWSRSGDFADAGAWERYVEQFTQRLKTPLKISVTR